MMRQITIINYNKISDRFYERPLVFGKKTSSLSIKIFLFMAMQRRFEIGHRLKDLRKKNKFSQQYVAENLFISQAAYSLIENSQNGIVAEHIINLSKLYNVTTDFLLKGDKKLVRMSHEEGFIRFIQVNAHGGYVKNSKGGLDGLEFDWCKLPGYKGSQDNILFEVEGASMNPTILQGEIIICHKQQNLNDILDGSVVLVVTDESILVKRLKLQKNQDEFLFENDNPAYEETIIFKHSEIKEIFMVRGKISQVLNTENFKAAGGKIKSLEDSIEELKKELFFIHKKLQATPN